MYSPGKVYKYAKAHEIALDSSGSLHLLWAVRQQHLIYFEVTPPSEYPDSWIAVGFSDRGDLTNADYCFMWTDYNGKLRIQDTWSDEHGILHVDYQQDCFPVRNSNGYIRWKRHLNTCDIQDYDYTIDGGTTHIVWARGRGLILSPSGINVTEAKSTDRGMVRAQLLRADVPPGPPADAENLEVKASKVKVPADETTYWCHVQKLPASLTRKHHVVEFEAVIQKGNEGLVHHMEVFHCEAPPDQDIPLYVGPCQADDRPAETQVCKKVIAAWAMGAGPFVYPEEAGLPIGGSNFSLYVMLEVHYNNPELRGDYVDSSGMRLWVTTNMRPLNAAVMELGLEYTDKMAIPPGQKEFALSGYCVSGCTKISLPAEGITVFGSQLHTHLTGVWVKTRHIRNGQELPELNADAHYSTHFQEIRRLKRLVNIKPDAIISTK
ncbi:tyramine beta-hydroxylase-like, partial [Ctenocephalides felis]|uniref:tyramine beta-hydroxylase-like n=1 Tax=Ctenocephalides felis TaxID=7515 RepID=UPI000E6E2028